MSEDTDQQAEGGEQETTDEPEQGTQPGGGGKGGGGGGGPCMNCAVLEAQVHQLQAELDAAYRHIARLRQAIANARAACRSLLGQAQAVLSKRSGVPRGNWAFARGVNEALQRVLAYLEVD